MRVKTLVKVGLSEGWCPTGFLLKRGSFIMNVIAKKILC